MKIDVSDLLRKKSAKRELNLIIDEKSFYDGNETINILEPIKLEGILSVTGDIISLDADVSTVLEFCCSRCLEKFKYPVSIEIHEQFSDDGGVNKDEEIIFIDSDTIDITEVIENNIILTLPIKRLCSEDCKGLCQQCGVNLNRSECKCAKDDIDPRLAKLKDMFLTD